MVIYEGVGMAKIQIDLSKEEDKIVEVYKLVHDLNTKQAAIKQMILYFEAEIKPKKLNDKDYFKV
jgi:flavoprotein